MNRNKRTQIIFQQALSKIRKRVTHEEPCTLVNRLGRTLYIEPPLFFSPSLDQLKPGASVDVVVKASPWAVCKIFDKHADTEHATLTVEEGTGSDDGDCR